jgi:Transposase, Mutator family
VVDGLKGFPEAMTSVFPQTVVQTGIVHYAAFRDYANHRRQTGLGAVIRKGTRHNRPIAPPSRMGVAAGKPINIR